MLDYPCKHCDKMFGLRSDLMKHKKTDHLDTVPRCRDFLQGNCNSPANSCWYIHTTEQKEVIEMDIDVTLNEQVFHQAQEKTPPDQITNILMMLNKLSFQVEQLEKMSKKTL